MKNLGVLLSLALGVAALHNYQQRRDAEARTDAAEKRAADFDRQTRKTADDNAELAQHKAKLMQNNAKLEQHNTELVRENHALKAKEGNHKPSNPRKRNGHE